MVSGSGKVADASARSAGRRSRARLRFLAFLAVFAFSALSCTQLQKPEPEPYFAETAPPAVQEFRWSNGKLPKSLDPALAAAPPETDVVRALYEGLTETDPQTLQEIPGVAESWMASEDFRTWTFKLRRDARWSNGKTVTANDFAKAWKRLVRLGDKTAHRNLLSNIAGVTPPEQPASTSDEAEQLLQSDPAAAATPPAPVHRMAQPASNANAAAQVKPAPSPTGTPTSTPEPEPAVIAEDDHTLKVTLVHPDKEFPKLVANPIFRPIFSNGEEFVGKELNTAIVTNGPFRIGKAEPGSLVLERSENYWNRENVTLERVRIVAMDSPEQALAAYRAGELDAVSNANFSPLVLKLLTPYEDFSKTTHSALNLYEVNTEKAPFSDRRVRQALSAAIERERLTEGEMAETVRPALSFLAFRTSTKEKLTQDKDRARELLDEAGFPDGEGFPVIRLVINRNDMQQRVARAVARMWKQNLNVETEIIVKDAADLEKARKAADFDLVRRGVVFPTSNELSNFMALFGPPPIPAATPTPPAGADARPSPTPQLAASPAADQPAAAPPAEPAILTEDEALYQLRAIPLYFPTSYSLVKPYVAGFEMNSLDVLNLAGVRINSDWRPEAK